MNRSSLIKNRIPTLRELGKIKIGMKGQMRESKQGNKFQPPVKLDHFLITTTEIGSDGNFVPDVELMKSIADSTDQDASKLKRIPVRLLFDDIELNFRGRYAAYNGKTVWCSGDGEVALRLLDANKPKGEQYAECECPCPNLDQDFKGTPKCKINGALSVLIDGAGSLGGVWKFRTTSFNSHDALIGSLLFVHRASGGRLAGIPLMMTVSPKIVSDPTGRQQTIHVVGLEFKGTLDNLRDQVLQIATAQAQAGLQVAQIETEARRLLESTPDRVFADDDVEDISDEFYPDENAPEISDPNTSANDEPAKKKPRRRSAKNKPPASEELGTADIEGESQKESPPAIIPPTIETIQPEQVQPEAVQPEAIQPEVMDESPNKTNGDLW